MADRDAIVAAARACVGARFRLHGRDPAFGLDCVGVVARAFGRDVPARYPPRGGREEAVAAIAAAAGLAPCDPAGAEAGDLLLVRAGPGQLHLAVLTPAGFVHADASLRRVVEAPGRPAGEPLAAWEEAG